MNKDIGQAIGMGPQYCPACKAYHAYGGQSCPRKAQAEKEATLALSSADSSGSDNVPLPSGSGEQPTSVERQPFETALWNILDSTGFPSCEVDYHRLVNFIAEERRQAKIQELELLQSKSYDGSWTDHDEYAAYIQPRLTELKRGENNE